MFINVRDKKQRKSEGDDFAKGVTPGYLESYFSGNDVTQKTDLLISARRNEIELYEKIKNEINRYAGTNIDNPLNKFGARLQGDPLGFEGKLSTEIEEDSTVDKSIDSFWETVNENQNFLPDDSIAKGASENNVKQMISEQINATKREARIMQQTEGPLNTAARWGGYFSAYMTDPINAGAALISGGLSTGASFGRAILTESLAEMTVETAAQPQIQNYREKHNLPHGWKQGVANVLTAPVAAAGFEGSQRFLGKMLGKSGEAISGTLDELGTLRETWDKIVPDSAKTSKEKNADYALETYQDVLNSNPYDKNINAGINKGETKHVENLKESIDSLKRGEPADIEQKTTPEVKKAKKIPDKNMGGFAHRTNVEMQNVKLEPETFQFKSQADEQGVTGTLTSEDEWKNITDRLILYERKNGDMVVADGHQRVNLAKRLMEEGKEKDIRTDAFVFREKDGFTPKEVKKIAAAKNFRDGFANPVDAARILKTDEEFLERLPKRSALRRDAKRLTKLDSESLDKVVKDDIPSNYAGMVGRVANDLDPEQEKTLLDVLNEQKPATMNEARSMVDQAKMAFKTEKQETLFGEEEQVSSLIKERSKVLDKAIRKLRDDRATFNKLVENKSRIEEKGENVVDEDVSEQVVNNVEEAVTLIKTQANKVGAISDDLTKAARNYEETGNLRESVDSFVESVKEAINRGDVTGESVKRSRSEAAADAKAEQDLFRKESNKQKEAITKKADDLEEANEGLEERLVSEVERFENVAETEKLQESIKKVMKSEDAEEIGEMSVTMVDNEDETITKTINEIMDDLDKDDKFLNEVEGCL